MKKIFPIIIATATALTVLAGYYLQEKFTPLVGLLINWGIILVGMTGIIGIGYLINLHGSRVVNRQKGKGYSLILLIAFLWTFGTGLVLNPKDVFFRDWVLNIQTPVETSLLAVIAIVLLSSSLYLIRTRGWTPMSISFIVGTLIALFTHLGILRSSPDSRLGMWLVFIHQLPLAGLRGILIGMALGGLIVGLRVLLTLDRPYDGQ